MYICIYICVYIYINLIYVCICLHTYHRFEVWAIDLGPSVFLPCLGGGFESTSPCSEMVCSACVRILNSGFKLGGSGLDCRICRDPKAMIW